MSGFSSASGIIAARHALDTSIRAALAADTDVDITFGPSWPPRSNAWVSQQGIASDTTAATLGPTRQQAEQITLYLEIGAWAPGSDDTSATAAFDRAFALLSSIQDHIRTTDITLGGSVLWCIPGPSQSDGAADEDGSGYVAVIAASFIAQHRIRTSS